MKSKSIYISLFAFILMAGHTLPLKANKPAYNNCSLSTKAFRYFTLPYLKLNILNSHEVVVEEDTEQKIVETRGDIVLHFYTDATMQQFGNPAYVSASISITGELDPLITNIEEIENFIIEDATLTRSHYYKDGGGNWVLVAPPVVTSYTLNPSSEYHVL